MTEIRFTSRVEDVDGRTILRLPDEASEQLPSRGQVAARWKWVRWINATRTPETRKRRVQVGILDGARRRRKRRLPWAP